MEGKELKKRLAKIPDVDKNGDPIYKIADVEKTGKPSGGKTSDGKKKSK